MQRIRSPQTRQPPHRHGALTVEVALIMPVFILFLAGIMEFGHFYLVVHSLNAAARKGAHLGSFEDVTVSDVEALVKEVVQATVDSSQATVIVKDGSVFDTSGVNPSSLDYDSLPSIDLSQADTGDCFVVQVKVPYDKVSLLPPFWIKGHTVVGRAVMRHE